MRVGLKSTSVVKVHRSTISLRQNVRHTSTVILIAWYQLTYFDALSSYSVPYLGYRIVEEIYIKYSYILSYVYAGSTCIYVIKLQSAFFHIFLLIKMYF
jgi:hypothetical protein